MPIAARLQSDDIEGTPDSVAERPISPRRRILFYLVTPLLILIPIVAIEALLAFFQIADPDSLRDPLAGFTEIRPLFVLNEEKQVYEIAPSRREFFNYDSFPAKKPTDGYRIFCLGGSTVAGRPYANKTSFTQWLKIGLSAVEPDRQWEVVNCGGVSYASYRLVPIFTEVLKYDPDLIVLYTGHNEFLEDRTFESIKNLPWFAARPIDWASQLRSVTLLRTYLTPSRVKETAASKLPIDVQTRLDFEHGLDQYDQNPVWRENVIKDYRRNIRHMVRLAEEVGVPVLLVNPGCNLRDCPPFKSLPKQNLGEEDRARFRALCRAARESYRTDPDKSLSLLLEAIEIDDENAAAFYEIGKCQDALGRTEEAFAAYTKAKDLDICPLRILESMNESVLELAKSRSLPLVDAKALLIEQSQDGIPGNDIYIDHVHPTIHSHQLIADWILESLIGMLKLSEPQGWRERRTEMYAEHLSTLDDLYYAKGLQRLERLQSWAAGRSDVPRK